MTESTEVRRKRVLYRSWHRGTRELDEILGPFAERHVGAMTGAQLDRLESLLERPDPELFSWFVEREPVPPEHGSDVLSMILAFTAAKGRP
ncbi:MAG: FAD assembly factor SdhE [Alphaproteobacteria bacterium]